jgi:hypothetical protein
LPERLPQRDMIGSVAMLARAAVSMTEVRYAHRIGLLPGKIARPLFEFVLESRLLYCRRKGGWLGAANAEELLPRAMA